MKIKSRLFFLLGCLIVNLAQAKVLSVTNQNIIVPNVLAKAATLQDWGQLEYAKNGYVFLKVPNTYVEQLYPILLQYLSQKEKVCISKIHNSRGAHITVLDDWSKSNSKLINHDQGEKFYFRPVAFRKTVIRYRNSVTIWYGLNVKSPKLTALQTKLNPFPKYADPLHISIAEVRKSYDNQCYYRDSKKS